MIRHRIEIICRYLAVCLMATSTTISVSAFALVGTSHFFDLVCWAIFAWVFAMVAGAVSFTLWETPYHAAQTRARHAQRRAQRLKRHTPTTSAPNP